MCIFFINTNTCPTFVLWIFLNLKLMENQIDQTLNCKDLTIELTLKELKKIREKSNLGDIIEIFGNNNDLKQNLLSWCKKNDSVIIREETLEQNVLRYLVLIK